MFGYFDEPKNAYLYYRKRKENSVKWTNFKGKVVNQYFVQLCPLEQIKN